MRIAAPHGCQGHRHRLAGQALGRGQAGVARNHHTLAVHEDRVGKPELLDRRRNLPDLLRRMGPGVAGVRDQRLERAVIDGQMLQEGPLRSRGSRRNIARTGFQSFPG